jgi:outer membrane protein assembly factor BamB
MTTGMARPTLTNIPALSSGGGGGRSTPAKSAVGEAGQGAVTLANVRPSPPPGPNPMLVQQTRVNPANPPGGQLGAGPFLVYALAGDGMLHSLHISNGADYQPPVKFLPPGAHASSLIVTGDMAYAVTQHGCGGAANGVWAIDLLTKEVRTWKGNIAGSAGMAFSGDGVIYVATGSGGDHQNSLIALDPKTLAVKESFSGSQEFSTSPVIFTYSGKTMIAVASKDGRIHLFDSSNLKAPLTSSSAGKEVSPGALASWQETGGTRWILAPTAGAVVAWKIVEQNGAPTLQTGWTSRELTSPLTPTIINGVVFVTSSGEFRTADSKVTAAQRVRKSSPAVLYALDGSTGKELWNSGSTITSFTRSGALSGGMSQIYVTTHDGTIYAFGYPMEH